MNFNYLNFLRQLNLHGFQRTADPNEYTHAIHRWSCANYEASIFNFRSFELFICKMKRLLLTRDIVAERGT